MHHEYVSIGSKVSYTYNVLCCTEDMCTERYKKLRCLHLGHYRDYWKSSYNHIGYTNVANGLLTTNSNTVTVYNKLQYITDI